MRIPSDVTIIGLHGFPTDQGFPPCRQLEPLVNRLAATYTNFMDQYYCWSWTDWSKENRKKLAERRSSHRFAEGFEKDFRDWFEKQHIPPQNRLIYLAFSAGGTILYKHLSLLDRTEADRILAIFVVASLHRCPGGYVVFEGGARMRVTDPPIPRSQIVKNLENGKLTVILAGNDTTVVRSNSTFVDDPTLPGEEVDFVTDGRVTQVTIDGAGHPDVLRKKGTQQFILGCLGEFFGH